VVGGQFNGCGLQGGCAPLVVPVFQCHIPTCRPCQTTWLPRGQVAIAIDFESTRRRRRRQPNGRVRLKPGKQHQGKCSDFDQNRLCLRLNATLFADAGAHSQNRPRKVCSNSGPKKKQKRAGRRCQGIIRNKSSFCGPDIDGCLGAISKRPICPRIASLSPPRAVRLSCAFKFALCVPSLSRQPRPAVQKPLFACLGQVAGSALHHQKRRVPGTAGALSTCQSYGPKRSIMRQPQAGSHDRITRRPLVVFSSASCWIVSDFLLMKIAAGALFAHVFATFGKHR